MAPLYVLSETSAGYAILKSKDKKLLKRDDLVKLSTSVEDTCNTFKLKNFVKWENAAAAVSEATALTEARVTPMLRTILQALETDDKSTLLVADPKLASAIAKIPNTTIKPIADSSTLDIFRAVREHISSLIPELVPSTLATTNLGLSHSLSRHKVRFSPDKVDTMIIQAVSLLDDLDKELNTYAMRVREWYGWHFPEMAKIINDNLAYARVVLTLGMRTNSSSTDLSDILPEEIEGAVKAAAEISMGTEISQDDLEAIKSLAEQVVDLSEFRITLSDYLSSRMQAIAPNLTAVVGELIGARLISHAGSLLQLSKNPASTIQILGAEKALFRALKTKHDTPKYGLIYHASLIGQATGRNKGKMSRMLAAKSALSLRVDAHQLTKSSEEDDIAEEERSALGREHRRYLEKRLQILEGRPLTGKISGIKTTTSQPGKFDVKEARKYNSKADAIAEDSSLPSRTKPGKIQVITNKEDDDEQEDDDDDDEDEDEDEEDEDGDIKMSNGKSNLSKEERKKIAKAEKKAAKAVKKAAKAAKKEAKIKLKAVAGALIDDDNDGESSKKKRKREEKERLKEEKRSKKKAKIADEISS